MEKTSATMNKQLTLTSPPSYSFSSDDDSLPILPFDLIEEILCRLPVKLLLQLRCACKLWNSLISHPKFAKKHLRMSTTCRLHRIRKGKFLLKSYPLHSVFTDDVTTDVMQLSFPSTIFYEPCIVASCNGILCIADFNQTSSIPVLLWNPSIRKFKELPLLQKPIAMGKVNLTFGFGYDSFTDNYKVVVVLRYFVIDSNVINYASKTDVKVHTMGTYFWKSIQECPFGVVSTSQCGKFVSGKINWLTCIDKYRQSARFIVSFDLEKESFRKVLPPDDEGVDTSNLFLGVLRDFLCIISGNDIWIMKEYGIQESWTKLFIVSNMQDPSKSYIFTEVVYTFEDDQVLLECFRNYKRNLVVYDSKNGTFKFTKFKYTTPEVCIESLISPCF